MKLAIISDTHFGDKWCTLVRYSLKNGKKQYEIGKKYLDFKEAAGKNNDYLILLGDVFDFSVASYKDAYDAAKVFFKQVQQDEIAKEMIIIPGNHDGDLWHTVEYEVNVIDQLKKGRAPRHFKMSVPGLIDDRNNSVYKDKGLVLPDISEHEQPHAKYGGLFLDHITQDEDPKNTNKLIGKPTIFNFVYPNLYLLTDNESILLTHGHLLDEYWTMTGNWALKVFGDDLNVKTPLNLKDTIALNFPLSQLACSGIGQAGALTELFQKLLHDINNSHLTKIKKYLNKLDNEIDKLTNYPWTKFYMEILTDLASKYGKKKLVKILSKIKKARFDKDYYQRPAVKKRLTSFINSSIQELKELNLNKDTNFQITMPKTVIFGHTHDPIPWNYEKAPQTEYFHFPHESYPMKMYNSGGWIKKENPKTQETTFVGAEVFIYETKKGIRSISIR